MRTITLRHLDNREFARIRNPQDYDPIYCALRDEFECDDEDAFTFDENEDGSLVKLHGQPVAQSYVTYGGRF